jgi:hypothetical protein
MKRVEAESNLGDRLAPGSNESTTDERPKLCCSERVLSGTLTPVNATRDVARSGLLGNRDGLLEKDVAGIGTVRDDLVGRDHVAASFV